MIGLTIAGITGQVIELFASASLGFLIGLGIGLVTSLILIAIEVRSSGKALKLGREYVASAQAERDAAQKWGEAAKKWMAEAEANKVAAEAYKKSAEAYLALAKEQHYGPQQTM